LRIGKTSAVFQEAGKTPLSQEALMMEVIQGTMVGKLSFSTRGGTSTMLALSSKYLKKAFLPQAIFTMEYLC